MLRLIWTAADALTYDGTYTNESLSYVVGLFVLNSPNAYAHYTYGAIVRLDVDEFAQARWFLYRFDPVNGYYLGRDEFGGAGLGIPVSLSQSLDRSVWVQQQTSNRIRGAVFPGYALKSHYWDSNYWTGSAVSYQGYLIDLQRDRAILAHNGTAFDQVDVYKLSDGSLVSSHKVAGVPQAIFAEDDTRVFVMSEEGVITLLDYEDGGVLGVIRHTPAIGVIEQHLVWDSYLRRVVALHWTADVDGQGTSRLYAYFPEAQATHLSAPIPLSPPRDGLPVPLWVQAMGDAGEPVGGLPLTWTTDSGTLRRENAGTSRLGIARNELTADEGSATVDVTS